MAKCLSLPSPAEPGRVIIMAAGQKVPKMETWTKNPRFFGGLVLTRTNITRQSHWNQRHKRESSGRVVVGGRFGPLRVGSGSTPKPRRNRPSSSRASASNSPQIPLQHPLLRPQLRGSGLVPAPPARLAEEAGAVRALAVVSWRARILQTWAKKTIAPQAARKLL